MTDPIAPSLNSFVDAFRNLHERERCLRERRDATEAALAQFGFYQGAREEAVRAWWAHTAALAAVCAHDEAVFALEQQAARLRRAPSLLEAHALLSAIANVSEREPQITITDLDRWSFLPTVFHGRPATLKRLTRSVIWAIEHVDPEGAARAMHQICALLRFTPTRHEP